MRHALPVVRDVSPDLFWQIRSRGGPRKRRAAHGVSGYLFFAKLFFASRLASTAYFVRGS
jgi:hypothetical protein